MDIDTERQFFAAITDIQAEIRAIRWVVMAGFAMAFASMWHWW